MIKLFTPSRHTGGSRRPEAVEIPGFRVALAIASLPGMTSELFREFLSHHTRVSSEVLEGWAAGFSANRACKRLLHS